MFRLLTGDLNVPDDLANTIRDNAQGPAKAAGDAGSVEQHSYARRIVLTLAHDVVGTGPRLQLLTEDAEANRRIEQAFMLWAKAVVHRELFRQIDEPSHSWLTQQLVFAHNQEAGAISPLVSNSFSR